MCVCDSMADHDYYYLSPHFLRPAMNSKLHQKRSTLLDRNVDMFVLSLNCLCASTCSLSAYNELGEVPLSAASLPPVSEPEPIPIDELGKTPSRYSLREGALLAPDRDISMPIPS